MKITDIDIAVLVQGPIVQDNEVTAKCLKSIRKHLPHAQVILSTWSGSDLSGLTYDIVVENQDPGHIANSPYQNTNRLILSSKCGLEWVTRKYVVKFRTDNVLIHAGFIEYFQKFEKYNIKYKIFADRVVALCTFAKSPNKWPGLFHISDMFFFGRLEDIRKIFNISLIDPQSYNQGDIPILAPEQYIWLACLNNNGYYFRLNHFSEITMRKLFQSEYSMINNFVFIEPEMAGVVIDSKKYEGGYKVEGKKIYYDIYHFKDWVESYNNYCVDDKNNLRKLNRIIEVYRCAIIKFCKTRNHRYLPKELLLLVAFLPLLGTIFRIRKIFRRIHSKFVRL